MSKGSRSSKEGNFIHFDTQSPNLSQPRAKSPSPVAQAPTGADPPKRFQFIDNTALNSGSNNSTQVRRHVMQEFMRQKRWNSAKQQPSSPGKGVPPARRPVQKIRAQKKRSQQLPSSSSTDRPTTPGLTPPPTDSGQTSPVSSASFPTPTGPAFSSQAGPSIEASSFSTISPELPRFARRKRSADIDVGELSRSRPVKLMSIARARRKLSPRTAYARALHHIGQDLQAQNAQRTTAATGPSNATTTISMIEEKLRKAFSRPIPHPRSSLSAARTDPFNSLPMRLDEADYELFDFYVNVMPTCSYGLGVRAPHLPSAHNWHLSVFLPEAMRSALTFQTTVLAHAAKAVARIRGFPETPLSIEHRHHASSMLKKHFRKHPSDTSDSTIVAMLSAAVLEDLDPREEHKENGWQHFRAAQKKIRDRGASSKLQDSPRLAMIINWADYIMTGYHSKTPSFFFDNQRRSRAGGGDAAGTARREVHETVDELLQFLRCMEHLALVQSNIARGTGARRAPLRHTSFAQGSLLRSILTEPLDQPRIANNLGGRRQRHIVARMACLLTLNAVNWQYRHSTELVETFLAELNAAVAKNRLEQSHSTEALLQILLSGSKHRALQDSERPWLVGRMLKIVKRLGLVSWARLEGLLLSFLSLEGVEEQVRVEGLEGGLHYEIFGRPPVALVMPNLAEEEAEEADKPSGPGGGLEPMDDDDAMVIP